MTDSLFQLDPFSTIHQGGSLQDRLSRAHRLLQQQCPGVARIGVALFDESLQQTSTYLASPFDANPLQNYQVLLSQCESLAECARLGQVRVVNDMSQVYRRETEHSRIIRELGMFSSYTMPILEQEKLCGFIFVDSEQKDYFKSPVLEQVGLFSHLLAQLVVNHQAGLRTLVGALRITGGMMHYKDPETGSHLERMARFARLIARELVAQGLAILNDEEIDHIFRFAPLHDIGKVGIPDEILQKPGRLDADEWKVMKTHSGIGRVIVDKLISEFGLSSMPDIDVLRHIAELHHEKINGSGYPHGLLGEQIPLAARIVSVSDIFDALTSDRPYKEAWSNQQAFAELDRLVTEQYLDENCVAALHRQSPEVQQIQQYFRDC